METKKKDGHGEIKNKSRSGHHSSSSSDSEEPYINIRSEHPTISPISNISSSSDCDHHFGIEQIDVGKSLTGKSLSLFMIRVD